jgi:hypothetical protein
MKTALFTYCVLMSLLVTAYADAPPVKATSTTAKVTKNTSRIEEQPKEVIRTGSMVKREVRRAGIITDGHQNLYVIDSEMIKNSGAFTLSQVLLRRGFTR